MAAIASAVGSVASAIAALWAVKQARDLHRESIRIQTKLRQATYFDSWVRNPVLESAQEFVKSAVACLSSGEAELVALASDGTTQVQALDQAKKKSIETFNSHYLPFRERLTFTLESWGKESLSQSVAVALDALQDGVTNRIGVVTDRHTENELPQFEVLIQTFMMELLRSLRTGDPLAK